MVSRSLEDRSPKQCRQRWNNHISPNIIKTVWAKAEDVSLLNGIAEYGFSWTRIARHLPGRSTSATANRFHQSLKRRYGVWVTRDQPEQIRRQIVRECIPRLLGSATHDESSSNETPEPSPDFSRRSNTAISRRSSYDSEFEKSPLDDDQYCSDTQSILSPMDDFEFPLQTSHSSRNPNGHSLEMDLGLDSPVSIHRVCSHVYDPTPISPTPPPIDTSRILAKLEETGGVVPQRPTANQRKFFSRISTNSSSPETPQRSLESLTSRFPAITLSMLTTGTFSEHSRSSGANNDHHAANMTLSPLASYRLDQQATSSSKYTPTLFECSRTLRNDITPAALAAAGLVGMGGSFRPRSASADFQPDFFTVASRIRCDVMLTKPHQTLSPPQRREWQSCGYRPGQ